MIDASDDPAVLLTTPSDPDDAAEHLVQLANEAGGEDNITVVVVDFTALGQRICGRPVTKRVTREPVKIDTSAPPGMEPVRMARAPAAVAEEALRVDRRFSSRLGAAGFLIVNYFLDQSWFVGVNEDGYVAVYQGIPEEVAGLDLKDEVETPRCSSPTSRSSSAGTWRKASRWTRKKTRSAGQRSPGSCAGRFREEQQQDDEPQARRQQPERRREVTVSASTSLRVVTPSFRCSSSL